MASAGETLSFLTRLGLVGDPRCCPCLGVRRSAGSDMVLMISLRLGDEDDGRGEYGSLLGTGDGVGVAAVGSSGVEALCARPWWLRHAYLKCR